MKTIFSFFKKLFSSKRRKHYASTTAERVAAYACVSSGYDSLNQQLRVYYLYTHGPRLHSRVNALGYGMYQDITKYLYNN